MVLYPSSLATNKSCEKFLIRSSSLICSGLAKLIYCPTMGGNLTRFKIFTHTENMVNAITMAAEEYQFILRII